MKAVLHLLGFLVGIQMKKNGFTTKLNASFNTNGYIASIAMAPMFKYRKLFIEFTVLCLLTFCSLVLMAATSNIPEEKHASSIMGTAGIIFGILAYRFFRRAKNAVVSGDTIILGKRFDSFMKELPQGFIQKLEEVLFIEKDTDEVKLALSQINGWETYLFGNEVYELCADYLSELAFEQVKKEHAGKIEEANEVKKRLIQMMNACAMIGAWPRESLRGTETGRLYKWATLKREGRAAEEFTVEPFRSPVPKPIVAS